MAEEYGIYEVSDEILAIGTYAQLMGVKYQLMEARSQEVLKYKGPGTAKEITESIEKLEKLEARLEVLLGLREEDHEHRPGDRTGAKGEGREA